MGIVAVSVENSVDKFVDILWKNCG